MLHRDVLALLDSIEGSPFAGDAKESASKAAAAGGFYLPDGSVLGSDAILLLWRCVAAARSADAAENGAGEFVATLPIGLPKGARPTDIVVAEMIGAARVRLVIMGYMFTSASGIVDLLAAAAMRGVTLQIVCDRKDGGRLELERSWPSFVPKPQVLVNAESDDAFAKMHSKLLIVDNDDILITSANFTYHGMYGNIEFGVRLRGAPSGAAANRFVAHLIETGAVTPAS